MPRLLIGSLLALTLAACSTVPRSAPEITLEKAEAQIHEADRTDSVALFLVAAQKSLLLATDTTQPGSIRREATTVYNRAVAKSAVELGTQPAKCHVQADGRHYLVTFNPPPNVDRFAVAETLYRKHLKSDIRRAGFGGAVVGGMTSPATAGPNRPLKGYALPWTAVAEFGEPRDGVTPVTIRFIDPRQHDTVKLAGAQRPLAGDFTAQFAYYPHVNELVFGMLAMLRSDLSAGKSALVFYEPYDPKRIPLIFVHGLMSSPHAWLQVANDLNADPEFRRRYQIGSFFYPTGAPIAGNAMLFRNDLADFAKRHPNAPRMVIIGHSMGGILTRMQVTNSGRTVWNTIFQSNADKVFAQVPADSILKHALIWKANPHVSRVVFIATPHRGSRLANLRAAGFAASLIRMPGQLVKTFNSQLASVMPLIDPSLRRLPTSILGLSPDNRLLIAVSQLKPVVPCYSIIGNRGRDNEPLEQSSDGVVPYWSSHLDAARSELIVPTGHDAFNNPKSVAELQRILARNGD